MLIPRPDKIRKKMRWDSQKGYYLTDPHTEEEQKLLDEFVEKEKKMREMEVYIDPDLLKEAGIGQFQSSV